MLLLLFLLLLHQFLLLMLLLLFLLLLHQFLLLLLLLLFLLLLLILLLLVFLQLLLLLLLLFLLFLLLLLGCCYCCSCCSKGEEDSSKTIFRCGNISNNIWISPPPLFLIGTSSAPAWTARRTGARAAGPACAPAAG